MSERRGGARHGSAGSAAGAGRRSAGRSTGRVAVDHDVAPGNGPHADPDSVARTICLNQLDTAPRTRMELAQTLRRRLVPDDAASRVLDRLEEVGLIDDQAFAHAWVRSRQMSRKLSGRALARELASKGIDADAVEEALVEVTPESEESAATALVRSKLRTMRRLDAATRERRLAALLGRKGYSGDVVFSVVRREAAAAAAGWHAESVADDPADLDAAD